MTDLHKIWHDDAERVSQLSSLPAVKNLIFKNPRWWTTDTLERPVVHHNISRFFDLKLAAVRAVRLHIINAGHV